MSRKLCSLCLAVAVFISTLSIAYADDMARVEVTEGDYALAVAALADAGLDTGFVSGRASTQRLYESGLPAGGQDTSLNELQFLALDEMEAEALSRQAQREQLAANLALLDQYDGVKLASSATVYSDAGSTDSGHTIDSGKVARLEDIDATGRWYLVSFSSFSGYISADVCTPVDYSEYDGTDAVRAPRRKLMPGPRPLTPCPSAPGWYPAAAICAAPLWTTPIASWARPMCTAAPAAPAPTARV